MKTLIQKELRENLKLAALGIVIFTLLILQSYHDSSSALQDVSSQPYGYAQVAEKVQPLLASGFLTQTCFFCAILGALLGWMQIFNERHRDLQAFLLHRPATRTQIFLGKSLAGIALYLLTTGLPLLCLLAWVRFPGHLATPSEWRMAIPSLAYCLAGLVFYFAGMLTGLRQARWYASRGLGIAGAVVVCFAIRMSTSLWEPLVALGLGLLVMTAAAWGAFETSGHYQWQPVRGKIALTISLMVGAAAVLVFVVGLLTSFFSQNRLTWSYYSMDTNGLIYKVTQAPHKQPQIVDLQGKPLLDEKTGRMIKLSDFNARLAPGSYVNVDFEPPPTGMFAEPSRYFLLWGATQDTIWYLWNRYGRLVGYDLVTRRIIGSIGPNGFSTSLSPSLPRRLAASKSDEGGSQKAGERQRSRGPGGDGVAASLSPSEGERAGERGPSPRFVLPHNYNAWSHSNLLNTRDTVYDLDLENRAARPLFTTTSDDPIGGAVQVQMLKDKEQNNKPSTLAATRHFIHLVEPDPRRSADIPVRNNVGNSRLVWKIPYQPSYPDYTGIRFSPLLKGPDPFALWLEPSWAANWKRPLKLPSRVMWLAEGGAVTRTVELPTRDYEVDNQFEEQLAAVLMPPALGAVFPFLEKDFRPLLKHRLLAVLSVVCCAAFYLSLVFWFCRRYSVPARSTWGWLVFLLFTGVPGLLAFFSLQEWPAREPCPSCHKLRIVTRETCEHCNAPFAPPPKIGIEIFDPA